MSRGKQYDREYLISQIAKMRIKGKSTQFILDFLMEEIGMARTTAYEILQEAREYINQMTSKDVEKALNEAIQQLEEMMSSTSDVKSKLAVRAELSKLLGLYAAQKVEHSGEVKFSGIDIQIISPTQSNEIKD